MRHHRLRQLGRIAMCAATCTGSLAGVHAQGRTDTPVLIAQAGASTVPPESVPRPAEAEPAKAPEPVGKAPEQKPPEVAPLFEQAGVLTPKGKFVFEPSFQYAYSTSNRVALIGYTIIPAIVIGVIDVREVKRTSLTTTLTGRWGVTNRTELEFRLPYVLRSDDSVGRELQSGTPTDAVFNAKGNDIGDFEAIARVQLNDGGVDQPFYVASLRLKTRTGKDPFEVQTATGIVGLRGGLQTELPTGSGFYGLQPALTVLFPSDPAVLFGTVSYLYSFKRDDVTANTDQGPQAVGTVTPGGVFGLNFGMGMALNEKSSFSIGYEHNIVEATKVNGVVPPGVVRIQLATLLLGYSYRFSDKQSLNLSVGAGLTADTPSVTLTLRLPITF